MEMRYKCLYQTGGIDRTDRTDRTDGIGGTDAELNKNEHEDTIG
jgi:hypothetical protein